MATTKRRKKKRKSSSSKAGGSSSSTGVPTSGSGGGGGVMQNIRSGFQRAAGVDDGSKSEKSSTVSNVLWTIALLAAVGFLLYRWYG